MTFSATFVVFFTIRKVVPPLDGCIDTFYIFFKHLLHPVALMKMKT